MVFIESPASVGFSYSDEAGDKVNGDAQTALDNYNLIQAFLARFPQYRTNALYISSESYGGHYMPTLAKQIVNTPNSGLNFKGFAVGNPYTDVYSGTPAMIDTYWGHQLIAKPTYDSYQADCVKSKKPNVRECAQLEMEMMNGVGDLNSYALDYPICTTDSSAKRGRAQRMWFLNHLLKSKAASAEERKLMNVAEVDKYEPCADDWGMQYLNQASVKRAIHVKETIPWMQCSYTLDYNMTDSSVSTAPIYNYLIDGKFGLDILVYSGDDDSVCGTVGTQNWIWDLGYEVSGKPWQTYTYNQQTAGYLTKWKDTGFAFTTIHGAGHEVPTYKPDVALDMWTKYLNGELTSN
jgi:carboxypeptidase C (cathepsin A)